MRTIEKEVGMAKINTVLKKKNIIVLIQKVFINFNFETRNVFKTTKKTKTNFQ